MRHITRSSMAIGAAVAAGVIAMLSAVIAWSQLQQPADPISWGEAAGEIVLGVALPLGAILAVICLCWLARSLGALRRPTATGRQDASGERASRF